MNAARLSPAQHLRPDRRTAATVSPLPPPEEVFADWLMAVPHDADIAHAALLQVDLIDGSGIMHPDLDCLRLLMLSLAREVTPKRRIGGL